jgi:single-strand DNA-binding protein
MSRSLNKATIIGHAGKDAEVRYTSSGKPVASFSVATSDSWKDKNSGQMQERTDWHNVVAWDRLAEICGEYVKKGKRVYIEGRIQNRSYDDKEGNKKYISEIVASDMILLDGAGGSGNGGGGQSRSEGSYRPAAGAPAAPVQSEYEQAPVDDLPF